MVEQYRIEGRPLYVPTPIGFTIGRGIGFTTGHPSPRSSGGSLFGLSVGQVGHNRSGLMEKMGYIKCSTEIPTAIVLDDFTKDFSIQN